MPCDRILIVEDNPSNLKLVRDLLWLGGFETLESTTAGECLGLAAAHEPRLILMDIQLPDMDGEAALRLLRAQPATGRTRVIALTAYAMQDDRQRLLEAGFDGYLAKPINVRTFVDDIRRYMVTHPGQVHA